MRSPRSKRGSHLALTLERLDHWLGTCGGGLVGATAGRLVRAPADAPVQRIGLSATQRPLERIAQFLVGPKRDCEIVDAGVAKELDLEIVVPVEDMAEPGAPNFPNSDGVPAEGEPLAHVRSIWPAIYPELLKLVQEHTSTIIFVNARRAAERLAKRLNELANGRRRACSYRATEQAATPGIGRGWGVEDGPSASQTRPSDPRRHRGAAARPARSPAPTTAPSPTRSGLSSRRC